MDQHPVPVLPDLLGDNLRVVFCGTAAGRISAERGQYYAHPGNRFWRMLHETGLTPSRLDPADWRRVADYGIGLTDVCKTHSGQDRELPADAFLGGDRALADKIGRFQPRALAFTSKTAGRAALGGEPSFGRQEITIGATALYVLPSTSGANGHWGRQKQHWFAFAEALRANL